MEREEKIRVFRSNLRNWWQQGRGRRYLWREQAYRTPYRTVLAELMLRRTKADQVENVYRKFIQRYPDLSSATAGDREEQRKILYPLGLIWRINGILDFLDVLATQNRNQLPVGSGELRTLPGIGDYVGNAVACFAGNDSEATLIDVNVTRVLGRIFGLPVHAEARRQKPMRELAMAAVDRNHCEDYHYALLDFAALICTARSPQCESCTMNPICDHAHARTGIGENRIQ